MKRVRIQSKGAMPITFTPVLLLATPEVSWQGHFHLHSADMFCIKILYSESENNYAARGLTPKHL